jgi:hypothetical protein
MKVRTNVKAGVRDITGGFGTHVVTNTVTTGSTITINDSSTNTTAPPV